MNAGNEVMIVNLSGNGAASQAYDYDQGIPQEACHRESRWIARM